mgnify:CR=1 FL=1
MSILKKYTDAIDKKDETTMNELLHDDFKFTMHKSGNTIGKADVIKWAMSGDTVSYTHLRAHETV